MEWPNYMKPNYGTGQITKRPKFSKSRIMENAEFYKVEVLKGRKTPNNKKVKLYGKAVFMKTKFRKCRINKKPNYREGPINLTWVLRLWTQVRLL